MLSAAELADMQATSIETLSDTCVIHAPVGTAGTATWVSDGMGGGSYAYTTEGSATWTAAGTFACRVAPGGLSPSEPVIAGAVTPVGYYTATFEAGTVVSPKSRITALGKTFEVLEYKVRSDEVASRVSMVEVGTS